MGANNLMDVNDFGEGEFEYTETAIPSSSNDIIELSQLHAKQKINQHFVGFIEAFDTGYAKTKFSATEDMISDHKGLIHTGFIFGAADFCAMIAIDEPNAVLAVAKANFLGPMELGDEAVFEAHSQQLTTRKRIIKVVGTLYDIKFFEAEFSAVILEKHILNLHLIVD